MVLLRTGFGADRVEVEGRSARGGEYALVCLDELVGAGGMTGSTTVASCSLIL